MFNFSNLSFPVPLKDVHIFEKNNPGVSVNIFSFKKGEKTFKNSTRKNNIQNHNPNQLIIVPYKICDQEKPEHFDLLLFSDESGKQHYCVISDFSRLITPQMTGYCSSLLFCKRCFKSFKKNDITGIISGHVRLQNHKGNCVKNKPATACMPEEKFVLKFENWRNFQRHQIVIYADFECLLKKTIPDNDKKTKIIQEHVPMSYCGKVVTIYH